MTSTGRPSTDPPKSSTGIRTATAVPCPAPSDSGPVVSRGHRMLLPERLIERLTVEGAIFVTMAEACDAYRVRYRTAWSRR